MTTDPTTATSGKQETPATDGLRPGSWKNVPLVNLVLAIIGGGIAWGIIEATHPVFTVPAEYDIPHLGAPAEQWDERRAVEAKVDRNNAMFVLTWFGALVAATIAGGEVIARRRQKHLLFAVPIAALAGCAAGFVGSLAYAAIGVGPLAELNEVVMVQVVVLGTLGLGIGLALAVPGRVGISAMAGLGAGALAGVLYPVVISLLVPAANTDSLVPAGSVNRLFWIMVVAVLLGPIMAMAIRPRKAATEGPVGPTTT